jgi:hypothetical protein
LPIAERPRTNPLTQSGNKFVSSISREMFDFVDRPELFAIRLAPLRDLHLRVPAGLVRRIVDRRQIFDRNAPDERKVPETLQFVEFDDWHAGEGQGGWRIVIHARIGHELMPTGRILP